MSVPLPLPLPLPLPSTSTTKKTRRIKPHIELAADQPLTTQGKPRARVYVACLQCRTRKIRCDGAKPTCHNCTRRVQPSDTCTYDPTPKRRGPDKTPGARQRMAREARRESDADLVASRRRRRKRHRSPPLPPQAEPRPLLASASALPPVVLDPQLANMPPFHSTPLAPTPPSCPGSLADSLGSLTFNSVPVFSDDLLYHLTVNQGLQNVVDITSDLDIYAPVSSLITAATPCAFISPYQDTGTDTSEDCPNIIPEPSLEFVRQTWWDSLLALYSVSLPSSPIPISERQQAANQITSDLRFFFRSSNYWVSFINVPRFLSIYFDTNRRARMQPSLLLAALALATFFQSSEAGFGQQGRRKAIRFRDIAQGALEASVNARWIDEDLAQAAWLLALFEVCAHPDYTNERSVSALVLLDTIIRTLSLTFIDMEDPTSARFSPRAVPSITFSSQSWATNSLLSASVDNTLSPYSWQGCSCVSRSLGQRWPAALEYTPLWLSGPAWDSSWSEAEIRKETCRRLCWSTLALTANYTIYSISANHEPFEFFVLEPANFMLLFPGEAMLASDGHSGKDTIWSLNYRTMLLWHSCLRMRHEPTVSKAELVRFALDAWLEADVLEAALDSHKCDLERAYLFCGREFLFNVRMILTFEFQQYVPVASGQVFPCLTGQIDCSTASSDVTQLFRERAKEWLTHQAIVAQRVVQSLGSVTGYTAQALLHRPFFVFWFMGQTSRVLSLWERDNSLALALDVGTAFCKPIDYLSSLWPCPRVRRRSRQVREQLAAACRRAGRPLPPPNPADMNIDIVVSS